MSSRISKRSLQYVQSSPSSCPLSWSSPLQRGQTRTPRSFLSKAIVASKARSRATRRCPGEPSPRSSSPTRSARPARIRCPAEFGAYSYSAPGATGRPLRHAAFTTRRSATRPACASPAPSLPAGCSLWPREPQKYRQPCVARHLFALPGASPVARGRGYCLWSR